MYCWFVWVSERFYITRVCARNGLVERVANTINATAYVCSVSWEWCRRMSHAARIFVYSTNANSLRDAQIIACTWPQWQFYSSRQKQCRMILSRYIFSNELTCITSVRLIEEARERDSRKWRVNIAMLTDTILSTTFFFHNVNKVLCHQSHPIAAQ